jgi:hypothetical protein
MVITSPGVFSELYIYGVLRETIAIVDPAPIAESITQRRKPSEMATADMQTIYRAQLASLWESIEGSQVNLLTSDTLIKVTTTYRAAMAPEIITVCSRSSHC